MKYRNLYLGELERQKEKAIEVGKPDGDFAEEWVVIAVAMKYPSYHPAEASKIIEKDFGMFFLYALKCVEKIFHF